MERRNSTPDGEQYVPPQEDAPEESKSDVDVEVASAGQYVVEKGQSVPEVKQNREEAETDPNLVSNSIKSIFSTTSRGSYICRSLGTDQPTQQIPETGPYGAGM